jgi:hypothetical protein
LPKPGLSSTARDALDNFTGGEAAGIQPLFPASDWLPLQKPALWHKPTAQAAPDPPSQPTIPLCLFFSGAFGDLAAGLARSRASLQTGFLLFQALTKRAYGALKSSANIVLRNQGEKTAMLSDEMLQASKSGNSQDTQGF